MKAIKALKVLRKNQVLFLVALPFVAFVSLFLVWPTLTVLWNSVWIDGQLSASQLIRAMSGTYQRSFVLSVQLGVLTAIIGGTIGIILAIVAGSLTRPKWLRSFLDAWSAVASQLGGIPLAFAFIALLGTQGVLTAVLKYFGIDIIAYGFSLSSFSGWVVVYLYFQIPLMFLVVSPAVEGLKPEWREAATILGSSGARFWRAVGIPVLFPSIVAGYLLLFVNSFAAYATAYALSSGAGQLVPLQIRFILQGNVITGEDNLGFSLVTWTIVILLASLIVINRLQKRVSKWTN
ncbi:MAG: ABC transporter permease [Candidatus Nanopelagicales bacterium]